MAKDVFDQVPQGMLRSSKRGRIKPAPNPVLSNLKQDNTDLRDRLDKLEALLLDRPDGVSPKKKGKASG